MAVYELDGKSENIRIRMKNLCPEIVKFWTEQEHMSKGSICLQYKVEIGMGKGSSYISASKSLSHNLKCLYIFINLDIHKPPY